ncbi:type II toxin-antitoxin system Phd/YefM family antitoxin [Komagataeibacter rhaeticus]|nr:type II toxin-antitoxin system Phd/YefM family antitoxin [Komagataeibacter rhaeticus]
MVLLARGYDRANITTVVTGGFNAGNPDQGCQGQSVGGDRSRHAGEPSIITRHGKPTAVVLSYEEYRRLSAVPSFGRLLMSLPDEIETERGGEGLRDVAF